MTQFNGESSPDSLIQGLSSGQQSDADHAVARSKAKSMFETFTAPTVSAAGQPSFFPLEKDGTFGLAGRKLQRNAADTFRDEEIPFWKRLVFDVPTQIAHSVNETQMKQMALFDPRGGEVFNRDTEQYSR